MNQDVSSTIAKALGEALGQGDGFDLVDLVPIPTRGDKMVRLRTLEEALGEFDDGNGPGTIGYLIQIRPRQTQRQQISAPAPEAPPNQNCGVKASLESIYLPNGKMNIPFLVENAELLLRSREYSLAKNIYKTILASGERTAIAHLGLARCHEAEGKLKEACASYEDSITYQPSLDAFQRLAAILTQLKKDARAAEILERALGIKELDQGARLELLKSCASAWLRAEKSDSAEKHLIKALELSPSSDSILVALGGIYQKANRTADAKAAFQKAIGANPKNDKALSALGMIALSDGDKRGAHDCFARALDSQLNNPTALFHLVKCAYEIKSYATAARLVESYIEIAPVNANLLYSLAGLQFHLGRIDEARATTTRILDLQPEHAGAKDLLQMIQQY